MRKIYKEQLVITDRQVISIPKGSQILTVRIQKGNICLWFSVDVTEREFVERHIRIAGMGHPIANEKALQYIGTVQMAGGDLVWHIFENVDLLKEKKMNENRNSKILKDFTEYCEQHPKQRFWQALRDWSGYRFIFASDTLYLKHHTDKDTFYWEEKNK